MTATLDPTAQVHSALKPSASTPRPLFKTNQLANPIDAAFRRPTPRTKAPADTSSNERYLVKAVNSGVEVLD